jgi:hypothetical protein
MAAPAVDLGVTWRLAPVAPVDETGGGSGLAQKSHRCRHRRRFEESRTCRSRCNLRELGERGAETAKGKYHTVGVLAPPSEYPAC